MRSLIQLSIQRATQLPRAALPQQIPPTYDPKTVPGSPKHGSCSGYEPRPTSSWYTTPSQPRPPPPAFFFPKTQRRDPTGQTNGRVTSHAPYTPHQIVFYTQRRALTSSHVSQQVLSLFLPTRFPTQCPKVPLPYSVPECSLFPVLCVTAMPLPPSSLRPQKTEIKILQCILKKVIALCLATPELDRQKGGRKKMMRYPSHGLGTSSSET